MGGGEGGLYVHILQELAFSLLSYRTFSKIILMYKMINMETLLHYTCEAYYWNLKAISKSCRKYCINKVCQRHTHIQESTVHVDVPLGGGRDIITELTYQMDIAILVCLPGVLLLKCSRINIEKHAM